MQTFLPYPDFQDSAAVLDQRRLGKQRVETLQIMVALVYSRGWIHHPAVCMWRGYEFSLLRYQEAICYEWHLRRGYKDTCLRKTSEVFWSAPYLYDDWTDPPWLWDEDFHIAHQSNLVRKDPTFYGPIFEGVPDDLPYEWPEIARNGPR